MEQVIHLIHHKNLSTIYLRALVNMANLGKASHVLDLVDHNTHIKSTVHAGTCEPVHALWWAVGLAAAAVGEEGGGTAVGEGKRGIGDVCPASMGSHVPLFMP